MAKSLYGKYISRDIIEQSKYSQITAPMINYRGDRGGKDLTFQWSCITQPFVMDAEPEVNNVDDQFLLFAGTNLDDVHEFKAEIELPLGKEMQRQIITEPTFVYIPKGLVHGPIKIKSVKKPISIWDYHLSTKYSENWVAPEYSKYLAKPMMMTVDTAGAGDKSRPPDIQITHPTGTPFRYIRSAAMAGVTGWTKMMGIQANLCMGYFVTKYRDYCCVEPVHYHRHFDEWIFFIGGNPLDVEDFDAEIEMVWGKERERQLINSTCITHIPPGLIHLGQEHRRIGKPYLESINVAGTGNYYQDVDKVLLSNEDKGEVMIPEGARDWVPVTKE